MPAAAKSVYEQRGRLRKTLALVAAVERAGPVDRYLLEAMKLQPLSWWSDLARAANVKPPSQQTVDEVIKHFERVVADTEILEGIFS